MKRSRSGIVLRTSVAAGIMAGLYVSWCVLVPTGSGEVVIVDVAPGTPVSHIARQLGESGVVRNSMLFHVLARLQGRPLMAGEYGFGRVRLLEVLRMLQTGRVHLHSFLVREGDSMYQIADSLEGRGLAEADAFERAAGDRKLLSSLKVDAAAAEGYLFPDTYLFPKGLAAERIVETMVPRFFEKVSPDLVDRARGRGFSLHRLVTFASIVEREARVPDERPVISAVFHNRLKLGMLLQADPTVLYGLRRWDNRLSRRDLRTDHAYNTYRRHGLPPGPICNPGLACLEAAISPAKVSYLYFVTRKDGTNRHVFSRTLAQHRAAVRRSKINPREKGDGG